jgi:hypothetical protein
LWIFKVQISLNKKRFTFTVDFDLLRKQKFVSWTEHYICIPVLYALSRIPSILCANPTYSWYTECQSSHKELVSCAPIQYYLFDCFVQDIDKSWALAHRIPLESYAPATLYYYVFSLITILHQKIGSQDARNAGMSLPYIPVISALRRISILHPELSKIIK